MLNRDMRTYDYFQYTTNNAYGEQQLSDLPIGKVKMAIHVTNQSIQDNINYSGANYIGFTYALLDDSHVIQYGSEKLKVLYVNPAGRLYQVFMVKI